MELAQWRCTMLHGMYCGYPAGLSAIGTALGMPEDKRKSASGRALIKLFCSPRIPTERDPRTRIFPSDEPEKWALFVEYNRQDVVTEMTVLQMLRAFSVPEHEEELWRIDASINAYGVAIDKSLVSGAIACSDKVTAELTDEAAKLSGLRNPASVAQLKQYLADNGESVASLNKAALTELVGRVEDENVKRVLEIRQELGKTSVTKYRAMQAAVCDDGRVRGLMQFYGASRSGRWAGRLVQVQNLPRNYIETLDTARAIAKTGRAEQLRLFYGSVSDTLSQLIRTAFVPSDGNIFAVADFSAIEARVVAWLAGETWVNEVFATHGRIYEATASQMFGVPVEKIKKGNPEYALRQKGKVATLALGYGGSSGALIAMGALKMGLSEDELPDIVTRWRAANPNIVRLWRECENAAVSAVKNYTPSGTHGLIFTRRGDITHNIDVLTVKLPSGREIFYVNPKISEGKFGSPALSYMGRPNAKGAEEGGGTFSRIETFGGKIVENIVQAIARDCLAVTIERLYSKGYKIVFHVHDEVIIDAPPDTDLDDILGVMAQPIDWAPGLILKGAGFTSSYYMKD